MPPMSFRPSCRCTSSRTSLPVPTCEAGTATIGTRGWQTRTAQPVRVESRAQLLDERIESAIRQDPVQPLEVRMPVARRKVRRVHPHRRRLARRRSLAHRHGRSVYGLDRAGARPDPRLSPQAASALSLKNVRDESSARPLFFLRCRRANEKCHEPLGLDGSGSLHFYTGGYGATDAQDSPRQACRPPRWNDVCYSTQRT